MKRLAAWAFYAIGAVAIAYLALYAYVVLTGRDLRPGAPIRIFKKPDAPNYSSVAPVVVASRFAKDAGDFFFPSPTRGEGSNALTPSPRTRDGRCYRPA
ncbi:MAG: hypothetical protein JSS22_03465 [Proteobacteria bacterium]|nr:hypothetical protein [Pseudomonadota bacterium]